MKLNKKSKTLRDDLARLAVGESLAYRLTNLKQRLSAYHSAKKLRIRLKIQEDPMGNGLGVTRVK